MIVLQGNSCFVEVEKFKTHQNDQKRGQNDRNLGGMWFKCKMSPGTSFVRWIFQWFMRWNFAVKMGEECLKNDFALALLAMRPRRYQRSRLFTWMLARMIFVDVVCGVRHCFWVQIVQMRYTKIVTDFVTGKINLKLTSAKIALRVTRKVLLCCPRGLYGPEVRFWIKAS